MHSLLDDPVSQVILLESLNVDICVGCTNLIHKHYLPKASTGTGCPRMIGTE